MFIKLPGQKCLQMDREIVADPLADRRQYSDKHVRDDNRSQNIENICNIDRLVINLRNDRVNDLLGKPWADEGEK
jgi:hypothetical protein